MATEREATVAIPWRPQPDRMNAHARVVAFWEHNGFRIIEADSTPELPFSLSEARNNAVRQVTTPVVIVADADTIPDIGRVHQAIDMDGVIWPFERYRHIPADWVDRADLMAAPADREYNESLGGLLVTQCDLYWQLGGMDDRFERRWGYEDNAFHAAAETLATVHRLPGVVFSFNHDADRDLSLDNPNRHRWDLYKFARGKPQMMRELLKR